MDSGARATVMRGLGRRGLALCEQMREQNELLRAHNELRCLTLMHEIKVTRSVRGISYERMRYNGKVLPLVAFPARNTSWGDSTLSFCANYALNTAWYTTNAQQSQIKSFSGNIKCTLNRQTLHICTPCANIVKRHLTEMAYCF